MTEEVEENLFAGFDLPSLFAFVFLEAGPEAFTEFLNCCLGKPNPAIAKILKADRYFMDTVADCLESSQESLLSIGAELEVMNLMEASRLVFSAAGRARPALQIKPPAGAYREAE